MVTEWNDYEIIARTGVMMHSMNGQLMAVFIDDSANVWHPFSVDTELEWWSASKDAGPEMFIFPSARGTAINANNFLFRVLKEAGSQAGIGGVTHQMLRRTCST